MSWAQAFIK